jgi:hypothetical protein
MSGSIPVSGNGSNPKDWRGVVVVLAAIMAVMTFAYLAKGTEVFVGVLMGALGIVGGLLGHQQTSRNYERLIPPGSTISPPALPNQPEVRIPLPSSPGISIPPSTNTKE